MPRFSDHLRKILGPGLNPFGEVFPAKFQPPPPAVDGRTVALEILREYVCNQVFYRPMQPGAPPSTFQIKPENFHIEWPDTETDLVFPAVTIIHDRAPYAIIGLTSYIEEDTYGVYGPGTVVQWQSEYTEVVQMEIHCSSSAERRSIIAALEAAITPTEQMAGLRFRMENYFNQLVCFTLNDRELMDGPMSAKNRRTAQLGIEMRFNIVALVNAVPFQPQVTVNTDVDLSTGLEVTVDNVAR